jgi:hypothetical protein
MSHLRPILFLVMSIAVWQVAAASGDAGTLLVANGPLTRCSTGGAPLFLPNFYGYQSSVGGSYSPSGLTGGTTVVALSDSGLCFGTLSVVQISGFAANPGQNWLSSVTCGGVTNLGSSATFSYGGGVADWIWGTEFGFRSKVGSNVSCTIVHN